MKTTSGFVWLIGALAAVGCEMESMTGNMTEPSEPAGSGSPTAFTPPAAETDPRQLVSPTQVAADAWTVAPSEATAGAGSCAGVALGTVLAAIRASFPELVDVQTYDVPGPDGLRTMIAPPPVPYGTPPPPATETDAFVRGLMNDSGFGAIFYKGARCRAQDCADQSYWYFETDARCAPVWVGRHSRKRDVNINGQSCYFVEGQPLWRFPGEVGPRGRCDADWSAQDITGRHEVVSLAPSASCGGDAFARFVLHVAQGPELSEGSIRVEGSGIPFLDGRSFDGNVQRRRFTATVEETEAGACSRRRKLAFHVDFEGTNFGLPNGLGVIDVEEDLEGACSGMVACSASLHLIHPSQAPAPAGN